MAEELGEAFFAQARGAVGGGVAGEEGQGDRRIDVGKDGGGARARSARAGRGADWRGPRGGDQIVAAAHERAQSAGVIGGGRQRPEAMAVGAQQIGQQEGIAGIALAAGGE